MLDLQQTVAALVLEHSECAPILQRHRIDFCCRGEASLRDACARVGLDAEAVARELWSAIQRRADRPEADPRRLSTEELIGFIVSKHHDYLRKTLPFVAALADKVSRVHGAHNPLLKELRAVVHELEDTLIPHLDDEERDLFPLLTSGQVDGARARSELTSMHAEHVTVGELLRQLRAAAEDFATPEWACNSYRTLFSELEALEGDVLRHVHLENHVLLPRFAAPSEGSQAS